MQQMTRRGTGKNKYAHIQSKIAPMIRGPQMIKAGKQDTPVESNETPDAQTIINERLNVELNPFNPAEDEL